MDDARIMVLELGGKGYSCAQMVIIGALRLMGRENPDLVRSMGGLAQGVGCSGEICGALAGGLCLISLYTAKGHDSEEALPDFPLLMDELVLWFRETMCAGGAITCDALLGACQEACPRRDMRADLCGGLVAQTWTKAVSLLVENRIDPAVGRANP